MTPFQYSLKDLEAAIEQLEDNTLQNNLQKSQNYKTLLSFLESNEKINLTLAERILEICNYDIRNQAKHAAYSLNIIRQIFRRVKDESWILTPDFTQMAVSVIKLLKDSVCVKNMECTLKAILSILECLPNDMITSLTSLHSDCVKDMFYSVSVMPMQYKEQASKILISWLKILPHNTRQRFLSEHLDLWFTRYIPSLLTSITSINKNVMKQLELMEYIVEELYEVEYSENTNFQLIVENICNQSKYPAILKSLLEDGVVIWHKLWILFIKLLKTQVTTNRGSAGSPINSMLTVLERAFKMDSTNRCRAFECWNVLIENFSKEKKESVMEKQLKLLIIPLKSSNAKTEDTVIAKFNTWWYLVTKFQSKVDRLGYSNSIIIPFLNFAFGRTNIPVNLVPGFMCDTMKKKCLHALVEIMGHVDCVGCTEIPKLDKKLISPKIVAEHWSYWLYCFKIAVKYAAEDESMHQNIKCMWKSFAMTIADMPENSIRKDLVTEMVEVLGLWRTPSVLDTSKNLVGVVFNVLILELFDKRISHLLNVTDEKNNDLLLLLNMLKERTMYQCYPSCDAEKSVKKLKIITDFIVEASSKCQQCLITKVVKDLPPNDNGLMIWTALAQSVNESDHSTNDQVKSDIVTWPIKRLQAFDNTKYSAFTWYTMYSVMYPTLSDTVNENIWKILRSCNGETSIQFYFGGLMVILKNLVGKNISYNAEVDAFINVANRVLSVEIVDEFFPPLLDMLILMLSNINSEVNVEKAKYAVSVVKKTMDFVNQVLSMDDIKDVLMFVETFLSSINTFASTDAYSDLAKTLKYEINKCLELCGEKSLFTHVDLQFLKAMCKPSEAEVLNVKDGKNNVESDVFNVPPPKSAKNTRRNPSIVDTVVENGEEFVVIKSDWKFRSKNLTENQKEKLKKNRESIPALYQDLSQSQEEFKANWKMDSQDTSSGSKSESKVISENVSSVLKSMPSTDVVPQIMQNILLSETNKKAEEVKVIRNRGRPPRNRVSDVKGTEDSPTIQKVKEVHNESRPKSPRLTLKDRISKNLKILAGNDGDTDKSEISENTDSNKSTSKTVQENTEAREDQRPSRHKKMPRKFDDSEIILTENISSVYDFDSNAEEPEALGSIMRTIKTLPEIDLLPKKTQRSNPETKAINEVDIVTESCTNGSTSDKTHTKKYKKEMNLLELRGKLLEEKCQESKTRKYLLDDTNETDGTEASKSEKHDEKAILRKRKSNANDNKDAKESEALKDKHEENVHTPALRKRRNSVQNTTPDPNIEQTENIQNTSEGITEVNSQETGILEKSSDTKRRRSSLHNTSSPLPENDQNASDKNSDSSVENIQQREDYCQSPSKLKVKKPTIDRIKRQLAINMVTGHPIFEGQEKKEAEEKRPRRRTINQDNEPNDSVIEGEENTEVEEKRLRRRTINQENELKNTDTESHENKEVVEKRPKRRTLNQDNEPKNLGTEIQENPEIEDKRKTRQTVYQDHEPINADIESKANIEMEEKRPRRRTVNQDHEPINADIESKANMQMEEKRPRRRTVNQDHEPKNLGSKGQENVEIEEKRPRRRTVNQGNETKKYKERQDNAESEEKNTRRLTNQDNEPKKKERSSRSPKKVGTEKEEMQPSEGDDSQASEDFIESSQDSTSTTISLRSAINSPKVPPTFLNRNSSNNSSVNGSDSQNTQNTTEIPRNKTLIQENQTCEDDSKQSQNVTEDMDTEPLEKSNKKFDLTEELDTKPTEGVKYSLCEVTSSSDIIVVNDEDPVIVKNDEYVCIDSQNTANADTEPLNNSEFVTEDKTQKGENPIKSLLRTSADVHIDSTSDTQNDTTKIISDSVLRCTNDEASSPHKDEARRKQDFLNNTLEISPIKSMSPVENKSPPREGDEEYMVIQLSQPVESNGEPISDSPEIFTDDKTSPDKRDMSPPRDQMAVNNNSSPSLSLKKSKPQVRQNGRGAQMLGLCVPNRMQTIMNAEKNTEAEEHKRSSPVNTPARRNLKILNAAENTENANPEDSEDDETFLKFKKTLPTPESSPAGPILKKQKRKLIEIADDATISPACKRKRVSFHDPPVSTTVAVQKYIEPGGRSPTPSVVKRLDRPRPLNMKSPKKLENVFKLETALSKTVEGFNDEELAESFEMGSLDQTPSLEIIKPGDLNNVDPICLDLVGCQDPIENIAIELSSLAMKDLFIKELEGKIETVGELAKMTELEVNRLCIKAPKIKVAKKVLANYAAKKNKNKTELSWLSEDDTFPSDFDMEEDLNVTNVASTQTDDVEKKVREPLMDVEVQACCLMQDGEMQTNLVQVLTAYSQTDMALTRHSLVQTVESGEMSTEDMIKTRLMNRPDFTEKLSKQLSEISKIKIVEGMSENSKRMVVESMSEQSKRIIADRMSEISKVMVAERLPQSALVKLAEKLPFSSVVDDLLTNSLLCKINEMQSNTLLCKILEAQGPGKGLAYLRDFICDKYDSKDLVSFCTEVLQNLHTKL